MLNPSPSARTAEAWDNLVGNLYQSILGPREEKEEHIARWISAIVDPYSYAVSPEDRARLDEDIKTMVHTTVECLDYLKPL